MANITNNYSQQHIYLSFLNDNKLVVHLTGNSRQTRICKMLLFNFLDYQVQNILTNSNYGIYICTQIKVLTSIANVVYRCLQVQHSR